MKKLLFLFVVAIISLSCSRNSEQQESNLNSGNIDAILDVYIIDASGRNLVGTANFDSYTVTYKEPYFKTQSISDNPNNYKILTDNEGKKFVRIFLNLGTNESTTTETIVIWNTTQSDTFTTEYLRGSNYIIANKIYLNGNLFYSDRSKPKVITLTK